MIPSPYLYDYTTSSTMATHGWSRQKIKAILKEPDKIGTNRHTGKKLKLYLVNRVVEAESLPVFNDDREGAISRQLRRTEIALTPAQRIFQAAQKKINKRIS